MGVIIMLLIFAIALYIPIRYRYPKESKAHIHKIQKEIEKEREEEASRLKRYQSTPVARNTSSTTSHKTAGTTSRKSSVGTSKAAASKQQKTSTGSGKNTGIHFGGWPEEIHSRPEQVQRMNRGLKINTWNIKLDSQNQSAFIKSDSTRNKTETWYHVTLASCDCPDFFNNTKRKAPCKHIYALAHSLGLLNSEQFQTASKETPPDHFETHSEFAHIKFGSWPEEIHTDPKQIQRIKDGKTLRGRIIDFNPRTNKLLMRGSHDEAYHVTLDNCDCEDFRRRHLPCKHIYCLADILGLLSSSQHRATSKGTPPEHFDSNSSFFQDTPPADDPEHIKFDAWPPECHTRPEQIKRMKIGRQLKDHIVYLDPVRKEARMSDSVGEILDVTLFFCNCEYFSKHHLPCEHIYCLADSLGLLPPETETKSSKSGTRSGQKSTRKTTSSAMGSQKKSTASDSKFSSQKNAEPVVSSNIRFGQWPTKTHLQPGQEERMKRGHKIKDQFLTIDPQRQAAYMMNPDGAPYRVTLSSCDCKDFSLRHLPCEHIYCLADSFGLLPTKPAKRATSSSSAYSNIKFGHWPRRCHSTDDQIARIKKGKKLKNTIITLDWNSQVACMKGDSNMDYYVTLNSCNCSDFYRRHLPCEHIYCLADTLGLLEPAATQKKNARS